METNIRSRWWLDLYFLVELSGVDPLVVPSGMENLFVLVSLPAEPGLGRGASVQGGFHPSEYPGELNVDRPISVILFSALSVYYSLLPNPTEWNF